MIENLRCGAAFSSTKSSAERWFMELIHDSCLLILGFRVEQQEEFCCHGAKECL